MTDALPTLIDALKEDDPDQVESATNIVLDEYEARRQREAALEELAIAVDGRTPDRTTTTEGTAAEQLHVAIIEAEQQRLKLDAALVGYLADEMPASEAIDQAETVVGAISSVDAAADELTATLDESDRTLPPVLTLSGPEQRIVPKGADVMLTYTLENLGGSATSAGTISVDDKFPLTLDSDSFASLVPDSATSVSLVGTPTDNGVFEARVRAETDASSVGETVRLVVAAKADYLTSARDQTESLATTVADLRSDGGTNGDGSGENTGNGNRNSSGNDDGNSSGSDTSGDLPGIENKARTVTKRLTKQIERIESGTSNPNAVDNKIESTKQLAETIATQLAAGNTQLSSSETAVIQNATTDIIDSLESATNAAF